MSLPQVAASVTLPLIRNLYLPSFFTATASGSSSALPNLTEVLHLVDSDLSLFAVTQMYIYVLSRSFFQKSNQILIGTELLTSDRAYNFFSGECFSLL